ncbi:eukaryotic translation initiation factor 3 subunit H [Trematosphaeria pertusa]|uniref:Eukaryotic translation initiation factor 3 subunit H n=1 Tax=Trematosphaeria pertusa TaxID=390896 RepID=A0A6A6J0T7_9PLEO|nr:eukaryotic translation initiation factor 3 subunit H [Trematosphaeria pertusa]KAF2255782.1 eukaryotic translation initiation factor 3 subunit H [Trematosphaeria pertusa]
MTDPLKDSPVKAVQVEALVVMKLVNHAAKTFPTVATGSLVGMESAKQPGLLEITSCFPFPTIDVPATDGHQQESAANLAAAAPRAKANVVYQNEMIKFLREVNVDANNVGWYTSTSMGNFVHLNTIENQFFYQKEMNERTVALVHDVSRSSQGSLSLRAYRLSPAFVAAYKEGKFTTESLQKSGLRYQDILVELPVTIHNSHLLTPLLHQLPSDAPKEELSFPPNLAALQQDPNTPLPPLFPNYDSLDLSIDPFLEKTCDLLLESIENHHTELNNHSYYQRSLAREQAKITAWQQKRKAENAARTASKQPLLPEDEWQRLFKLPQEPNRLETLLNSRQVEQYARQVDGFTAGVSAKMFAVKSNLLPGE